MSLELSENYDILESAQMNLDVLKSMSDQEIKAAYLANLLAALVLVRADDRRIKMILRDHTGKTLKKYNSNMSPINFWGMVVHNSGNKEIAQHLGSGVAKLLERTSGRILNSTIRDIHYPLSDNDPVNWPEMLDGIRVITLRLPLRNAKVNRIRDGLEKWAELSANDKSQIVADSFYYLTQNDSNSILLSRLKQTSTSNLMRANQDDLENGEMLLKKVVRMAEDGTGAGAVGGAGGPVADPTAYAATATTSADIAPVPQKLFKGKIVKRIKRTFRRRKTYEKFKKKKN